MCFFYRNICIVALHALLFMKINYVIVVILKQITKVMVYFVYINPARLCILALLLYINI